MAFPIQKGTTATGTNLPRYFYTILPQEIHLLVATALTRTCLFTDLGNERIR